MTGPKLFKFCKSCQSSKPTEDFYRRSNGYLSAWCKPCTTAANNRAKAEKRRQARELAASLPPSDLKRCTKCLETKASSDFYARHAECKECLRERARARHALPEVKARISLQQAEYRERNRPAIRARQLARYGLSPEEYDARYDDQSGRCAICAARGERLGTGGSANRHNVLVVDHCHDSSAVRGLLCNRCNRAIGLLGDDIDTLRRAIAYLAASAEGR
ncbi:endonuclease VII domain-containing protein [Micromonospora okii]|uniref:endonuclease VII domain-containing protein n=1 Tax=Micromonospora okii TaxID=1182970 RepID=UPI001E358170|nr:endonuclease VII domain-containing protein [Micromonospora okii]